MSVVEMTQHFFRGATPLPLTIMGPQLKLTEAVWRNAMEHTTRLLGQMSAMNTHFLAELVKSHPYDSRAKDDWYASLKASAYIMDRTFKDYPDPGFNLTETTINGTTTPVTEKTISNKPFYNLQRFTVARGADKKVPKVLLIPPMSGHHPSLLRDTVKALLPGTDMHVVGWKEPRDVPLSEGDFDFQTYVLEVKKLIEDMEPDTHVMSVCQPNPVVVAALALIAQEDPSKLPCSATVMAGPIDTRIVDAPALEGATEPLADMFVAQARSVVPPGLAGVGREIHLSSYQLFGFMAPNWDAHTKKTIELFWNVQRRTFLEETIRNDRKIDTDTLRDWLAPYFKKDLEGLERAAASMDDTMAVLNDIIVKQEKFDADYFAVTDLHGEYLSDTRRIVFEQQLLPQGRLVIDGKRVDPALITCPIHVVEGTADEISPPGHSKALLWLCEKAKDACYTLIHGGGHYGVFSGTKWRENAVHRVLAFMHGCGQNAGLSYDRAPSEFISQTLDRYDAQSDTLRPADYPMLKAA